MIVPISTQPVFLATITEHQDPVSDTNPLLQESLFVLHIYNSVAKINLTAQIAVQDLLIMEFV